MPRTWWSTARLCQRTSTERRAPTPSGPTRGPPYTRPGGRLSLPRGRVAATPPRAVRRPRGEDPPPGRPPARGPRVRPRRPLAAVARRTVTGARVLEPARRLVLAPRLQDPGRPRVLDVPRPRHAPRRGGRGRRLRRGRSTGRGSPAAALLEGGRLSPRPALRGRPGGRLRGPPRRSARSRRPYARP